MENDTGNKGGYYVISRIHRDDVLALFEGEKEMEDFVKNRLDMEKLVDLMGDDYREQLFWSSARILTESLYDRGNEEDE